MSAVYRRWASARLDNLKPWIHKWHEDEIFAGADPKGAEDAWYLLALEVEWLHLQGITFCGGTADIFKFFDVCNNSFI